MISLLNSEQTYILPEYKEAEGEFIELVNCEDLDRSLAEDPIIGEFFLEKLDFAIHKAYASDEEDDCSHLFIQRCLYYVNRLKLFWYDDLNNYSNENSRFLFDIRSKIEKQWVAWEEKQISVGHLKTVKVDQALRDRVEADLNPKLLDEGKYIRDCISEEGYQRLLAIASLDGLVEASQLSRVLGGAGSDVQLMLTKILWEEYGGGKLERKHSSHFAAMLEEVGMDSRPEAYFDLAPWEVLANINHSFVLSEQKRKFLRYVGGLLFIEVSVPASFRNNQLAGERLGISQEATSYWDIHIKEDIRHGQWMLEDVALPLAEMYERDAWEIVLGYDQQKFISARASRAIVDSIRKADDD